MDPVPPLVPIDPVPPLAPDDPLEDDPLEPAVAPAEPVDVVKRVLHVPSRQTSPSHAAQSALVPHACPERDAHTQIPLSHTRPMPPHCTADWHRHPGGTHIPASQVVWVQPWSTQSESPLHEGRLARTWHTAPSQVSPQRQSASPWQPGSTG